MRPWLLRISVILAALAVIATGSWWTWHNYYSGLLLLDAVKAGNARRVGHLLAWRAKVNVKDERHQFPKGLTPLHYSAAGNGARTFNKGVQMEVTRLLINAGAATDIRDDWGRTPLHYAAGCPHRTFQSSEVHGRPDKDVVLMLIQAGASTSAADDQGNTPLHNAVETSRIEIVRVLMDNGADIHARNGAGQTPLQLAVSIERLTSGNPLFGKGNDDKYKAIMALLKPGKRAK